MARVGRKRQRQHSGPVTRKSSMAGRPAYHSGSGGMAYRASAANSAPMPATSAASHAAA
nr:hypothetical protein [Nocardia neocaledoniensis]